jgi:hypothetical protein
MPEYICGSVKDAGIYMWFSQGCRNIYVVQSRMPEYICGSANYDGIYTTE